MALANITHIVALARTFDLPIVHLVDCFGFAVGLEGESTAIMSHAVTAISAIHQSTIPWCRITVRNMFAPGGGHMPDTQFRTLCVAVGQLGMLPFEGGREAAIGRTSRSLTIP